MRRSYRVLVLMLLLLFSLAAVLFFIRPSEKKPIVLSYWTHDDASRTVLEERLISEFESLNPDIRIERRVYTSSELFNIVPAAFETGQGPDVFTLIQTSLDPVIKNGYVAEYPENADKARSEYIDGVLEGASHNGRIYGLPMEYTSWALYVNLEAIESAGIDIDKENLSTWEGIRDLSAKLVRRDDDILIRRGFDFRYPYYLNFLIPMVEQLGGGIGESGGKLCLIGEDAWEAVFDFFSKWGPLGDNLGSPTYINARSVFASGESAMMLSGLYNEERFKNNNPDFYEQRGWRVLPFPVFENSINPVSGAKYCHYWCVSSALEQKKQKAAWKFIEFLSDHYEDYMDEVYLLLPRREMEDKLSSSDIPYIDVFAECLEKSEFIYTGASSEDIRYLLEECVRNVMLGGENSSVAVERLRIALENLPL